MKAIQENFVLQERYLQRQLERNFLFSTNHCRTFTGMDLIEIQEIHDKYVAQFSWRFEKLNSMEIINALFCYLYSGQSIDAIRCLIEKITGRTMVTEQLSKAMRKMLFILGDY